MPLTARPTKQTGSHPIDLEQVTAELARSRRLRLKFAAALEDRYEAETRSARARNIRLTVPFGLVAYLAFGLVDSTLLPDLGWMPMLLRLFVITPAALYAIWMCSRVSASVREAFISVAITVTMLVPMGFIALSRAPAAPYTMLSVLLVNMFGHVTMRLRFHWACFFSAATLAAVGGLVLLRPDLPGGIVGALVIAAGTGITFDIFANNQLERAERRGFLLTLREALRSAKLHADKESYSVLSLTDSLTGLANRRRLSERLKAWRAEGAGVVKPLSIVMIDVDHFKRYNDHYGHPAGDVCLRRIAQAMAACMRSDGDLLARYGGEEFVAMLPDTGADEAAAVAERLCTAVAAMRLPHVQRDDGCELVTISAGVASAAAGGRRRARALFEAADAALYLAKQSGRNRYVTSAPLGVSVDQTPSDLAPLAGHAPSDLAPLGSEAW